MSTADAARMLGITPRTLHRLINSGDIPAYRIGRLVRLQVPDVEAFIERARIAPSN